MAKSEKTRNAHTKEDRLWAGRVRVGENSEGEEPPLERPPLAEGTSPGPPMKKGRGGEARGP